MRKLRLREVRYNSQEVNKLGFKTKSIQLELGVSNTKLSGLLPAPGLTPQ